MTVGLAAQAVWNRVGGYYRIILDVCMLHKEMSTTDPEYIYRVARLAYKYWEQRGCPIGSSDEDWYKAEREIKYEWEPYGPLVFG
jgi:hypothetical protein